MLNRPLEDCYQKRKRLLDFQVGSAPAENWQGLLAALHLQHTNTVYSSKKLMQIRRRQRKEPCKTQRLLEDRDMGNQGIVKAD
ncbi:hypothetical protein BDE02_12G076600 [Populus trichocarpa]|nr:hypothetical protein BDE02_12G076600 [Populus trichocarpa]